MLAIVGSVAEEEGLQALRKMAAGEAAGPEAVVVNTAIYKRKFFVRFLLILWLPNVGANAPAIQQKRRGSKMLRSSIQVGARQQRYPAEISTVVLEVHSKHGVLRTNGSIQIETQQESLNREVIK